VTPPSVRKSLPVMTPPSGPRRVRRSCRPPQVCRLGRPPIARSSAVSLTSTTEESGLRFRRLRRVLQGRPLPQAIEGVAGLGLSGIKLTRAGSCLQPHRWPAQPTLRPADRDPATGTTCSTTTPEWLGRGARSRPRSPSISRLRDLAGIELAGEVLTSAALGDYRAAMKNGVPYSGTPWFLTTAMWSRVRGRNVGSREAGRTGSALRFRAEDLGRGGGSPLGPDVAECRLTVWRYPTVPRRVER
jgi:hypothetical protein